jgi:hypothetical protein
MASAGLVNTSADSRRRRLFSLDAGWEGSPYMYLPQGVDQADSQHSSLDLAPGVSLKGLASLLPPGTPRHLVAHVDGSAAGAASALRALRSQVHHLTHSLLPALEATADDSDSPPVSAAHSCLDGESAGQCGQQQGVIAVPAGESLTPHWSGRRRLTAEGLTRALSLNLPGRALLQTGSSGCGSGVVVPTTSGSATPGALLSASQPTATCTGAAVSTQVSFCGLHRYAALLHASTS